MADLPSSNAFGDYDTWPGRDVLDVEGNRLGAVEVIFLDESTKRPEWVRVHLAGEAGGRLVMIPLAEARVTVEAIRVVHSRDTVVAAPDHGDDGDRIDQEAERALYEHYGVGYSEAESETGLPVTDEDAPKAGADADTETEGTTTAPVSVQPAGAPPERPSGAAGSSRLRRFTPPEGDGEPTETPAPAPAETPAPTGEEQAAPASASSGPSRQELIAGGAALASALAALALVLIRRRRS